MRHPRVSIAIQAKAERAETPIEKRKLQAHALSIKQAPSPVIRTPNAHLRVSARSSRRSHHRRYANAPSRTSMSPPFEFLHSPLPTPYMVLVMVPYCPRPKHKPPALITVHFWYRFVPTMRYMGTHLPYTQPTVPTRLLTYPPTHPLKQPLINPPALITAYV